MTTLLAYLEIALFLVTEGRLRSGKAAKSLQEGSFDRNSTRRIGYAFFLASRALLVGAVFAFTISMGEFGATVFIARPNIPTMPVAIFRFLGQPGLAWFEQAWKLYNDFRAERPYEKQNPGYARQRADVEAALPAERVNNAYIGRGAVLGTVTQVRDQFLEAQLPVAFGNSAGSDAASSVLGAVEVLDPQAQGGISDALAGFYSALTQLSQNPSDPGLRQTAVSAARTLSLSFQQTRASLEGTRSGVDQRLVGDVSEANGLATKVASLNTQIRIARASGGAPNDLLDVRQKAVDRLAELTGAVPVPTNTGDVSLFLSGGAALVSGDVAGTLAAAPDGTNGGHLALQLSASGITSTTVAGGEMGGLLSSRDGALRSAVDGLDTLAWDLAGAVNTVHQGGVDLDGNAGQPLFTVRQKKRRTQFNAPVSGRVTGAVKRTLR